MPSKSELQNELIAVTAKCGDRPLELIPILEQLAEACQGREEYDEAQQHYERILEIRNAAWSCMQNNVGLIKTNHALGLLHRIRQHFDDAEPHYKQALQISVSQYGERHAETVIQRNYLAGLYFAWGKFEEAEKLLKTSLMFYEESLGREHEVAAVCLYALALVTRESLDNEPYFERSVSLMKIDITKLSMDNPHDLFLALMHISHNKFADGKFAEAEELFRHSLLMELGETWPGHPLVTDSYQLLADLYRSFGMDVQAEQLYRRALSIRERVHGAKDLSVGASAHALGTLLSGSGRYEESDIYLQKACDIYRERAFPPVLANSLKARALVLKHLDRHAEASAVAAEAESIWEKHSHVQNSK